VSKSTRNVPGSDSFNFDSNITNLPFRKRGGAKTAPESWAADACLCHWHARSSKQKTKKSKDEVHATEFIKTGIFLWDPSTAVEH